MKKEIQKEIKKENDSEDYNNEDDEDDDEHKWWENVEDRSEKWQTLEHNGVMFPPDYEPLPKGVGLVYDGKMVDMAPEAEEVASFFGAMLNSENHTLNPTFQNNFFNDFKDVLNETGGATYKKKPIEINDFNKCNFEKIFEHYNAQREAKKALPSAEKKRLKQERDELEEPYRFCHIDGRKEPVGNFRVEPPSLFRGRGEHPKTGKLKRRVKPEQIIINIGKDAKIPVPPKGHEWGSVQHDNTVTWLANWKENINGNNKYVLLGNSSSLKGQSDWRKFEKARKLKDLIQGIRADYTKELDSKEMDKRQRATAMYLIDKFALRAGGEKGEDEADTVGCCSLRFEHVTLEKPNKVIFDFLGKDSIRFYQTFNVDPKVFRNLKIFKKSPKTVGDDIFDRLDPSILNKHLNGYMPGLTAKVFRTYNASHTMQTQLDGITNEGTVMEKITKFNAANRTVAILCNHQRSVSKNHETQMEKSAEKIREQQWQRLRHKKMILVLDKDEKKRDPKYFKDIDDMDKDEIAKIHEQIYEREKVRLEKKFQRENEKLKAEGNEVKPESELKQLMEKAEIMKEEFARELKTGWPELPKSGTSVEKLRAKVEQIENRINNMELTMEDKENNSTVALGTSKMNYIDPRLTVVFSKKYDVPIEKLFTKTLREKFNWAIQSADENWRF